MFPQYMNWFDPEEKKRQMLLAPPSDDNAPDQQAEMPASNTASLTPTLSPAQTKYKQALERVPNSGDFQPSKWRRLAAAIAGGFAGASGGPLAGQKIAQDLINAPYAHAMGDWQTQAHTAGLEAGVEEKAMAEEIARRRALAYEQSSTARTQLANTTQNYRNWQMSQPRKWEPTTKEDAFDYEQSKHPKPAPTWTDPKYVQGYKEAHPQRPVTDQMALERLRQEGVRAHDARYAALRRELAKNRSLGVPASAAQQGQAELLAAERLARTNTGYSQFIVPSDPTTRQPARIRRLDELTNIPGMSPSQESLLREGYRKFLADLDREKRTVLGSKSPDNSAIEDEEDQEFDDQIMDQDEEEDQ